MFYTWLQTQQYRTAVFQQLATYARSDPGWPRKSHRLYRLLDYCEGKDPSLRRAVKRVHRVWRQEAAK